MSIDYRNLLNKEQYEACTTVEGPLLILAGAGSGKTRAITHRIAYMIGELNIAPWSILAITFTNKAAREMKDRVKELAGDVADNMWISTFHSSCVRILRREIESLGYRRDFTIYDSYDQKTLIKQIMKELNIDEKRISEKEIMNAISSSKDKLITPEKFLEYNSCNFKSEKIGEVYTIYQKRLKNSSALDFDDIIMKTVELFRKFPETLEFYRNKFKYILVDEYQDTNKAQYELIHLLAAEHRNICVVGDDDQSIYQFRGADLRNILEFESDYPDAKVIKLEENYRSVANILKAANHIIQNNHSRKDKTMRTSNPDGEKIKLYTAFSDKDEAAFVSKEIMRLERDGRKFKEFSVLYRTNAQSRLFEESFMRNSIPYKIVGGLKFYDRKEIKDIMAYLRLINNPFDEVSLRRIINVPKRSLGDTSVNKIVETARENGVNMYDVIMDIEEYNILSGKALNSIVSFRDMMNNFMSDSAELPVAELLERVLSDTGYLDEYKKSKEAEDLSRVENIEELINGAAEFDLTHEDAYLSQYLEEVALVSDVDRYDEDSDAVVLMTVHSSKGLEFPVVFLVGMENGLFPSDHALTDMNEMEESRRLAYVAITRARELLYLTNAEARFVYGRTMMYPVSDFIKDIPVSLTEDLSDNTVSKPEYAKRMEMSHANNIHSLSSHIPEIRPQAQTKGLNKENVAPGKKVSHPKFGYGIIVGMNEERNDVKLQVVFDNYGMKTLMLSLAPLKLVEE